MGRRLTSLTFAVLLSACAAAPSPTVGTSTPSKSSTTGAPAAPPPPTSAARTVDWFDLDVGDCLTNPPIDDPNAITVSVVDCATPHQAEVFLRAPLAVNTAIAEVADRKCADGFTVYTGEMVGSGTLSVTYLIDSNQNRTSSNPDPSTVICLLQPAGGGPLTVSARR